MNMLPGRMRLRIAATLLAMLAVTVLAACGDDDETDSSGVAGASLVSHEAVEGEPIEIGGLEYNVQITRFLNPDDAEDSEYLVGQPPPPEHTSYLGVFMVIENESEDPIQSASEFVVHDTLDQQFEPAGSISPYALEIGAEVPPEGQLPLPNTTAATGPNHGALVIFPVTDDVSDNRPLRLEITAADDESSGEIILDI